MSPYYAGGLGIPYMSSMLNYGMGLGGMGMYGLGMGLGMGMGGMGMGMGYPYGMMMQNPYGYSGMVSPYRICIRLMICSTGMDSDDSCIV
jgi:hypothetical protein